MTRRRQKHRPDEIVVKFAPGTISLGLTRLTFESRHPTIAVTYRLPGEVMQ